ncbi:MAG: hypothetical protein A2270_01175 [Elusimicrobia bacterium RIFOXYA12_FULL_51_18]|nr:MAG: hypothetical protein A2270_01175 [Elusimicrobia bacterium RIFOXYA12_FULL_51_18]OGS31085.1 MAG: hypothetical protein A2218_01960 [Elusimicrobia bacterium RIFOXYA2_FULL_53_38]
MPYNCPNCGQAVVAAEINTVTSIATCPGCAQIFSIKSLSPFLAPCDLKPLADKPGRFSVKRECADIVISYRWFSFDLVFLFLFCLAWDGFAGFFCFTMFRGLPSGLWLIKIPPLLFASVGAVTTYYLAAGFVNRTFVRISPGGIVIRSGPLPWPGDRAFLKSDLKQLFCEETRTKKGNRLYHLSAVMSDDSRVKLLSRFRSPDEALFIEQQAESALGIKDQPVAGETKQWYYG